MKGREFFRQTLVETALDYPVMVSTVKISDGYFETIAFPVLYGVSLTPEIELARAIDEKPKQARKTHRQLCQHIDLNGREYHFNQAIDQYEPRSG